MGLFKDVVQGFTSGFATAAADESRKRTPWGVAWGGLGSLIPVGLKLGWEIDEPGEGGYLLPFHDALIGERMVRVMTDDGDKIAFFTVDSAARLDERQVDAKLMSYLLMRNAGLAGGMWNAAAGRGKVTFALKYCAFTAGVSPEIFKYLCESMVKEANDFDTKLRSSGLL